MLEKYNEGFIKRRDKIENVSSILRVKLHERDNLMEKINQKNGESKQDQTIERLIVGEKSLL